MLGQILWSYLGSDNRRMPSDTSLSIETWRWAWWI